MRISIISVGVRLPSWINQGVNEYQKRLPKEVGVELRDILPARRGKSIVIEKILKQEAEKITAAISDDCLLIVLDEKGNRQSTLGLSEHIGSWMQDGRDICIVIGGADGLHQDIKTRADQLWSLSDFTLPHGLARVVLMEQLYRAWTVMNNHPYHRA